MRARHHKVSVLESFFVVFYLFDNAQSKQAPDAVSEVGLLASVVV